MNSIKATQLESEGKILNKKILTKREKEVFELLVNNFTTKEIATKLGISEKQLEIIFQMQCRSWE